MFFEEAQRKTFPMAKILDDILWNNDWNAEKSEKNPILHLNFIPGKYDFKLKSWKNRGKTPKIVKKDIRDDP